ncbi:MAG: beta-ketoacyl-ACP synthase [Spirochaetaceae bacterium]|nr:beta-ketoacyl-ACP synthase [Spirochaetaceae bacterium]
MSRRVVITGGGCISSLGTHWNQILERLKSKRNCVVAMEEWNRFNQMNTRLAAPVLTPLPELPRKKIRGMGRVAILSLLATQDAIKFCGISDGESVPEKFKNGRFGVAYGSSAGNIEGLLDFYAMLIDNNSSKISATTYIKMMPQTCAVNLGVFYGLTGRILTTNTACTSGSMSIGLAYEAIKNNQQDIMLAGGAEELSAADAAVFDTLFAASVKNDTPELTPCAYDKNRDGLVVGEGAATLILEELEHAKKRNAPILAEIIGFGTNSDGKHVTQPNSETMAQAMELALQDANLSSDKIEYINMHGTATPTGDIAETIAVSKVLGNRIPVSTLKNYTGHTLGACGAIEAWVSINMMNEGWFCPNINLVEPDPQCAPLDYITGDGRNIEAKYIMSNNFAFGGINTSIIFKKWEG